MAQRMVVILAVLQAIFLASVFSLPYNTTKGAILVDDQTSNPDHVLFARTGRVKKALHGKKEPWSFCSSPKIWVDGFKYHSSKDMLTGVYPFNEAEYAGFITYQAKERTDFDNYEVVNVPRKSRPSMKESPKWAAEHALEAHLFKKFFEWLVKELDDQRFDNPLTTKLDDLPRGTPKEQRMIRLPGDPEDPHDAFIVDFPLNIIMKSIPNGLFNVQELILVPQDINGYKESILDPIIRNLRVAEKMEEALESENTAEEVFKPARVAILAYRFILKIRSTHTKKQILRAMVRMSLIEENIKARPADSIVKGKYKTLDLATHFRKFLELSSDDSRAKTLGFLDYTYHQLNKNLNMGWKEYLGKKSYIEEYDKEDKHTFNYFLNLRKKEEIKDAEDAKKAQAVGEWEPSDDEDAPSDDEIDFGISGLTLSTPTKPGPSDPKTPGAPLKGPGSGNGMKPGTPSKLKLENLFGEPAHALTDVKHRAKKFMQTYQPFKDEAERKDIFDLPSMTEFQNAKDAHLAQI